MCKRTALKPGGCDFHVLAHQLVDCAAHISQRPGEPDSISQPLATEPISVTFAPVSVLTSWEPEALTPKTPPLGGVVAPEELELLLDEVVVPEELGQAGVALGSGLLLADQALPVQVNHWQELFS
jgi:hypothetical protein